MLKRSLFICTTLALASACDEHDTQENLAVDFVDERDGIDDEEVRSAPSDDDAEEESVEVSEMPDDLTAETQPAAWSPCVGWDSGARWCWVQCANNHWYSMGHASVLGGYGSCKPAGEKFCQKVNHACWGWSP